MDLQQLPTFIEHFQRKVALARNKTAAKDVFNDAFLGFIGETAFCLAMVCTTTKPRERRFGEFHNILLRMRLLDEEKHFEYLRMTKEPFDELLRLVELELWHAPTHEFPSLPRSDS